jgi:hypothetical protein
MTAGLDLDAHMAGCWARSTLDHLGREFPNSLLQVLQGPDDIGRPRALHPIFFGSYDWHSCVHGWWQVMRIARLWPELPISSAIRSRADDMLIADNVRAECAYFERPGTGGFERPYGWGWLLALHTELTRHRDPSWSAALSPLAHVIAGRLRAYLPRLLYPVRHGVHSNTAFALILALDWAELHDAELAAVIRQRAEAWFATDQDVRPIEPSGEDFLSPTLCAALLLSRVWQMPRFAPWFEAYLPTMPRALIEPTAVSDRSDGRLAHLDGLNLSRAWCWRELGMVLGCADYVGLAERHLAASLPHIADDYMGEHWLATFALLAMTGTAHGDRTVSPVPPAASRESARPNRC